jgi:hypothetical protein
MKSATSRPLLLLAGLLVVVGLPVAGKWLRRAREPRCTLEGLKIEPLYRVRVVDEGGGSHCFCCIHCAGLWLARRGVRPRAVYVIDETSGQEMDFRAASFVQSAVVTNPITGNCVHAFRDPAEAEEHLRTFGGSLLTGAERPFWKEAG